MCGHKRGHITDSWFHGHAYATAASKAIFCDLCRCQRWLDVEAALALAQDELGMIPEGTGSLIEAAARMDNLDLAAVARHVRESGHSLVGLLSALAGACEGESGQYVHFGATTQDIQDTAQVLEMRAVLDELDATLRRGVGALLTLLSDHRHAVTIGRTHARPAVPMTLGVKVAGWIDEILRQAERIAETRARVLVVQLHGAVGTMAGFAGSGPALAERVATRLGLAVPRTAWHVARDRVAEFVCALAMTTASMARIADEIRLLSRPELGEFELGWDAGAIGSSTMPHKRNPEVCEQIVALSRLSTGLVTPALLAMGGDGERDARALRVEWGCVPDAAHYCLAACEMAAGAFEQLRVNRDGLQANLRAAGDEIFSENLMLALARPMGKQRAHRLVYELAIAAHEARIPLRKVFEADPACAGLLDSGQLDAVFSPVVGAAEHLTAQVMAAAERYVRSSATDETGVTATRRPRAAQ